MLIGLFALQARSISCCVKRSLGALCSEWPGGGGSSIVCSLEDELCLCARTGSCICAFKYNGHEGQEVHVGRIAQGWHEERAPLGAPARDCRARCIPLHKAPE